MADSDEPPPDKEKERKRLVSEYKKTKFSSRQLLSDFKALLGPQAEKVKVGGLFCIYFNKNELEELVCPGRDRNCTTTKIRRGCELRRGYDEHDGILGYFRYEVQQLNGEGDLSSTLQNVETLFAEENYLGANKLIASLHERMDLMKIQAEKQRRIHLLK